MIHRRDFLKNIAALIASGTLIDAKNVQAGVIPAKGINDIGVNLFSIPKLVEKDFAGTMKALAKMGYKKIEFYGPYTFSDSSDKERWASVASSLGFSGSGFYGLTVKQARMILDDNGLSAPSIHAGLGTLHNSMGPMAEAAHVLGTRYLVLPLAASQPNLDGYKSQADDFNAIGREAQKQGLRFAYHNHGNGLKPIEGKIPFDLVMESTDPNLVFFQMDIYWMTAGGADVAKYLDKYAGRFKLMHVKDMAKEVRFSGDGGDSNQWIELFPYLADAGTGILDLKKILAQAQKSGVEHFIVERDLAPEGMGNLKVSREYLSGLKLD